MKQGIWISYDLGIKGDYPSLYTWLDEHKAKECGDSLAFLNYEYKADLFGELKKDLENVIDLKNGDRLYVIFKGEDNYIGKFLRGSRKSTPWAGYSPSKEEIVDGI